MRALVAAQEEELFEWFAAVQAVTAEATRRGSSGGDQTNQAPIGSSRDSRKALVVVSW
jgi:hypothetical protein